MALLVLVYIKDILIAFGQDEEASELASIWYSIYIISFPFSSMLMAIYVFLLSQNVLLPVVITEVFNVAILLPLSMWLWTRYFGYQGTAAAVVTYETCGAILIVLYLCVMKPYKKKCWPGLIEGFKEAVGSWQANRMYLMLGAGGILASSECTSRVRVYLYCIVSSLCLIMYCILLVALLNRDLLGNTVRTISREVFPRSNVDSCLYVDSSDRLVMSLSQN
jgi:hypothetical protein